MNELEVLVYPQVIYPFGGPENVAYYLSLELKKHVHVSYYPSFQASFQQVSRWDYATQLVRVWTAVPRRGFDLLHAMLSPDFFDASFPLALLVKSCGLPLILNIHGIVHLEQPFYEKQFLKQAKALTNKAIILTLCKKASRIVVNSKFSAKGVIEWYGIEPEKLMIIPNGVNLKFFQRSPDHHERIMLEGDPSVLFVSSSFIYAKGVDTLIKAIAIAKQHLPNIKLHVIGTTSNNILPDFKFLIGKEGLAMNIRFHGWISQHEISRYYKSADFCVFPAILETFGIVVLEAMASGSPIIASDIEAYRELLTEGTNALFFQPSSPEDLSKAVLKLALDSKLRKRLSTNALEAVQIYDWTNVALKYIELYKSVIS
jgi:glycosyltransferase involved in cell wall biosynthesis